LVVEAVACGSPVDARQNDGSIQQTSTGTNAEQRRLLRDGLEKTTGLGTSVETTLT
jgi:hypothetical protein